MKPHKYIRYNLLLVFFSFAYISTYAQQDDAVQEKLSYLTTEQKQLLKEQQQLLDNTRAIFKQTLTSEQRALINDRNISKEQRTALLRKSLTSSQLANISSNRNLIRNKKNVFRRTLTKKQRIKLRRFIKKRPLSDRKRLVRRLRRLLQNNMD